eukprot:g7953.t1
MSTVGYGDLAPTIWYSQLLGIGFILVGIIVVFGQLGEVVGFVIEPFFDKMREVLDRIWKPTEIEIKEGNKVLKKIKVPARPVIYFTKGLIGPLSILLLFQFLSAIIFVFVEPGWDLWTAWWYVMVTATTVGAVVRPVVRRVFGWRESERPDEGGERDGDDEKSEDVSTDEVSTAGTGYGDFSVSRTNNDGGLIWASLHILLSCSLLAALIGDISELKQERREQLIQIKHYLKCHEPETLQALDKDGDQKLRKEEFVLGMLKKIGKLDKEDVQFIEAIFDNIDAVDGVPDRQDGSVNTEKFERAEVRSKMSTERELAWKKLSFCVKQERGKTKRTEGLYPNVMSPMCPIQLQELKYMDVRNAMKDTRFATVGIRGGQQTEAELRAEEEKQRREEARQQAALEREEQRLQRCREKAEHLAPEPDPGTTVCSLLIRLPAGRLQRRFPRSALLEEVLTWIESEPEAKVENGNFRVVQKWMLGRRDGRVGGRGRGLVAPWPGHCRELGPEEAKESLASLNFARQEALFLQSFTADSMEVEEDFTTPQENRRHMAHFSDCGKHCSDPYCKQKDMLPFECDACGKTFCAQHFKYDAHQCPHGNTTKDTWNPYPCVPSAGAFGSSLMQQLQRLVK